MKKILVFVIVMTILVTNFSFVFPGDPKRVPEKYEKIKNPIKADAVSVKSGKEIYNSQCRSCHGMSGKGDGNRAAYLDTPPANFTVPSFQSQSDGVLLYKIFYGHKDMTSLKKRILENENDVEDSFGPTNGPGDLVNYLRTLGQ